MIYFVEKIKTFNVVVRDIEFRDINPITDYWHESDSGYLQSIGVDINKIVSREVTAAAFQAALPHARGQRDRIVLIFEVDNKLIGYTNVNFNQSGSPFGHVHIIDVSYRNKGIIPLIFFKVITIFYNHFHIENLYLQTNVNNKRINNLLFKRNISHIKTEYISKPDGMGAVGTYNLFSCSREQAENNC
jgi:RimJ/RimL family protein N-acetyltransferase